MGYKELEVWNRSMDLVPKVYELTSKFPHEEQFGMTSQIRRAAISIPCNIAEGYGRRSEANFTQFLRIAKGSANELETLLVLSEELQFGCTKDLQTDVAKIGSMLTNLIASIKGKCIAESVADYVSFPDLEEEEVH